MLAFDTIRISADALEPVFNGWDLSTAPSMPGRLHLAE
jgi:hypothetical protein